MFAGAGANLNQQWGLPTWIGALLMVALVLLSGLLDVNKVTNVIGAITPFIIFFLTLAITLALMAMCARNVHLIFKTSEGRTRFSKGKTPFQPDNIRMVREIGIFLIAIPVVQFIMSIVARIALGPDMVESSLGMQTVFMGLVVLALSQYFAYGMQLQGDVDGLL